MKTNRRHFVGLVALSPLAVVAARGMAAEPPAACADPASLPLSQKSRRRSVEYVDLSTDPARHCGLCNFFTAAAPGCGTCTILGGGTVSAAGVCTSFAPRSGK
ncbi:MAG: high-potential iron-sulfur protein [Sphingomonadales bacterium]|nr:high-potential iron-sulfur protein [Sphingomonadales bacterium]